MSSQLPPLYTTLPLASNYQYPCHSSQTHVEQNSVDPLYTVSPLSTHNSHTISPSFNSFQPPSNSVPASTLTFPKLSLPLPPSQPSTSSTESDVSDIERCSRSPSLLTCLFTSRQTSISSSSNPLTPLSTGGLSATAGKPILRRSPSTSASASTSDDGFTRFGLALSQHLAKIQDEGVILREETHLQSQDPSPSISRAQSPGSLSQQKRACLKFAVKQPAKAVSEGGVPSPRSRSNSIITRGHSNSFSLAVNQNGPVPSRRFQLPLQTPEYLDEEVESPTAIDLEEYEYESSDEGYREDEEDGFTSDEDIEGDQEDALFTRSSFCWRGRDITSRRRESFDRPATGTGPTEHYPASTETEDNSNSSSPRRGRKVSIASHCMTKPNKCSRHLSPPPLSFTASASASASGSASRNRTRNGKEKSLTIDTAPPAARSPSAAELCRRRGTVHSPPHVKRDVEQGCRQLNSLRGWKSDDAFGFASSGKRKSEGECKSILVKTPSPSMDEAEAESDLGVERGRSGSLPPPVKGLGIIFTPLEGQ